MAPVAQALDIMQRDANTYAGTLIGVVEHTKRKLLVFAASTDTFTSALARWVAAAVAARFKGPLEDMHNRKAATMHPTVKLGWTSVANAKEAERAVRGELVEELAELSPRSTVRGRRV